MKNKETKKGSDKEKSVEKNAEKPQSECKTCKPQMNDDFEPQLKEHIGRMTKSKPETFDFEVTKGTEFEKSFEGVGVLVVAKNNSGDTISVNDQSMIVSEGNSLVLNGKTTEKQIKGQCDVPEEWQKKAKKKTHIFSFVETQIEPSEFIVQIKEQKNEVSIFSVTIFKN